MAADVQGSGQALRRPLIDILKEPVDYEPTLFAKSSRTTDIFASNAKKKRRTLATVEPKLSHIIPCLNLVRQLASDFIKAIEGISVVVTHTD
ncbi:hypothetical protein C0992_010965 [Termitomyces sp. T32_za158]|nr:hypothetical protein C0992_010965 [Termitomyces sp. T32_za158]